MTNECAPKNRKSSIQEIRIVEKIESYVTDPLGRDIAAATGEYPTMSPVPGLYSEISGKPAYILMFDDLVLLLSFDELDRLFRHDLRNGEYDYLLDKYGMFQEINEDFYQNGKALKPTEIASLTVQRIAEEEERYKEKVSYALLEKLKSKQN